MESTFLINKLKNEHTRIGKKHTVELPGIVCAANCLECGPDRPSLNADWLEVSTLYYYAAVCTNLWLHG